MICDCIFGESNLRELLLDAEKDREIACRLIEALKWLQQIRDGEIEIQSSRDFQTMAAIQANHIRSALDLLEIAPTACGEVMLPKSLVRQ